MHPTIFDIPNGVKKIRWPANIRHVEGQFYENVDMSNEKKLSAGQILVRNVREAMDRLRITQAALAERGGLYPSQVSEVLNFVSSPTIDTAEKFAKGVGMQLWELLVDNEAIRERAIRQALQGSPAANDEATIHPIRAKKAMAARRRAKKPRRPEAQV